MQELGVLVQEVIKLTKDTGSFIQQERRRFDARKVEQKGLHDLVSYVDKEAEQQLVSALRQLSPGAGFITEEKTISQEEKEYNWIIDPLDGTTNFIHNLPVYSISIALYHRQEPLLGVVYELNREECFYSWKGAKAYLNNAEIQVSQTSRLADSLLATGFPYTQFEGIDRYLATLKQLMQHSRGIRRMGSAAVDLAYVACGRFDAFFEYNLNAWDVAAGAFIVQQAGGKVCNFSGGEEFIKKREIIAGNPLVMATLLTFM